jgi:hypothetical protein
MSRRSMRHMAPMAVTSDGTILLNAAYVLDVDDAAAIIKKLGPGAKLYIGVVVPPRHVRESFERLDDAVAEIAGVIGAKLTAGFERASASSRSSGDRASGTPGRRAGPARRRRGRRPSP